MAESAALLMRVTAAELQASYRLYATLSHALSHLEFEAIDRDISKEAFHYFARWAGAVLDGEAECLRARGVSPRELENLLTEKITEIIARLCPDADADLSWPSWDPEVSNPSIRAIEEARGQLSGAWEEQVWKCVRSPQARQTEGSFGYTYYLLLFALRDESRRAEFEEAIRIELEVRKGYWLAKPLAEAKQPMSAEGVAGDPKKQLSTRDRDVWNIIGERAFTKYTDSELIRKYAKIVGEDLGDDLATNGSLRARLKRIRKYFDLRSSREVRKARAK